MGLQNDIQNFVGKVEARWLWVTISVVILLRLRLVLFAAALPVMAYWHFSNQDAAEPEEDAAPRGGRGGAADRQRGRGDDDDEDDDYDDRDAVPRDGGTNSADVPWPDDEDDDDALFRDDFGKSGPGGGDAGGAQGADPYDSSFWGDSAKPGAGGAAKRSAAPPRRGGGGFDDDDPLRDPLDDDGDLLGFGSSKPAQAGGGGGAKPPTKGPLWGDADDPDDFVLGGLGGGKKGPGDGLGDFDFLGGNDDLGVLGRGLDDDLDFGGGFGMGGKGKGKGKGKKGEKGGKEPGAPREADPKQVFVANIGDMPEEEIRSFFGEVGDVERVKVLRTPEGLSKGVCFVTFATIDQAQKALGMSGTPMDGRNLVVRLAHGGNKGEKGDKGGGKGGDRFGGSDRFDRGGDRFDRGGDRFDRGPPDLGGSERFGGAFGDRDRDRPKGKGGGKGPGRGKADRGELDDLLEEALADDDGPLRPGDFDFAARRFLSELRSRDRAENTQRFQEAIEMVLKYTSSKDRSSVRKWPAYVFTLLQKFDPSLWEELRQRDVFRKQQKGGGGGFDRPPRDDRDRDDRFD